MGCHSWPEQLLEVNRRGRGLPCLWQGRSRLAVGLLRRRYRHLIDAVFRPSLLQATLDGYQHAEATGQPLTLSLVAPGTLVGHEDLSVYSLRFRGRVLNNGSASDEHLALGTWTFREQLLPWLERRLFLHHRDLIAIEHDDPFRKLARQP